MKITNNVTLAKAVKFDGNHSAGRGVYLAIRGGSRRWVYRFYDASKRLTEAPLGVYPDMTLSAARDVADGLRHARKAGNGDARAVLQAQVGVTASTFEADALAYHEHMRREWDTYHASLWLQSMRKHVFPIIGQRDTAQLTVADIVSVLEPIWTTRNDTAKRIHSRIRAVIEYAADTDDHGRFEHGNPADRALRRLPRGVAPEVKPHAALPWQDAPAFYQQLASSDHRRATAIRLLLLCCCPRTAEVIGIQWPEIEERWGFDVWHVPASRMKSGKARDIPLSKAAMDLLASIRPERATGYVFPSARPDLAVNGHIREDAMQWFLREDMGLPWTMHGMRATFRTWVSEHARTVRDHDAAEIALDHVIGNKVHRAYDRADMLAERRDLAERWAAFLMG
jgi:integrase